MLVDLLVHVGVPLASGVVGAVIYRAFFTAPATTGLDAVVASADHACNTYAEELAAASQRLAQKRDAALDELAGNAERTGQNVATFIRGKKGSVP